MLVSLVPLLSTFLYLVVLPILFVVGLTVFLIIVGHDLGVRKIYVALLLMVFEVRLQTSILGKLYRTLCVSLLIKKHSTTLSNTNVGFKPSAISKNGKL